MSCDAKKVFGLDNGRRRAPCLPTSCKKRNYKPILQQKIKDWKKVVENFPTSS
jgi:hypothetical protein